MLGLVIANAGQMKPLPSSSSDEDLIAYIDHWAALLEREEYAAAFAFTDHDPTMRWTPDLVREVIKGYGDALPSQRVTVEGKPTDISQRKKVNRWAQNPYGAVGEIWYDLNIDGFASDLTAIFGIFVLPDGFILRLEEIHVM